MGQKPGPMGLNQRGNIMGDKSFAERADAALRIYGLMLPADIRQLLRDMAGAIDQLREKTQ